MWICGRLAFLVTSSGYWCHHALTAGADMTTAPFEPEPEVAPGEPDETVPASDPNKPGQTPENTPDSDPMEEPLGWSAPPPDD